MTSVPLELGESWLHATHAIVDEELRPALKSAGFRRTKTKDHWTRPRPGGGQDALMLGWSRYARHDSDCASFQCRGDDRAKSYVMISSYWLGTDAAQVSFFVNSGRDALAEQILGPLGLLDRYRQFIAEVRQVYSGGIYALDAPMPADAVEIDRLTRRIQFSHRYRWSDRDGLRTTLRADVSALLLTWEMTAYSGNDRFLQQRIADAFDERGFFRSWVP